MRPLASPQAADRHQTFIPSSLIMRPMAIAGPPMSPPRSSSSSSAALYQRCRQRTPIIAASLVVVLLLIVHSVPRRKALVQHHETQSGSGGGGDSDGTYPYSVFDEENGINEGGEGDTSTPFHGMPWRGGQVPSDIAPSSEIVPPIDAKQVIEDATSDIAITSDAVSLGDEYDDLPYLHCGPEYGTHSNPGDGAELLLLHGAAFRASTWEESGILEGLCLLGKKAASDASMTADLSVTALDLPVSADALYLNKAFKSLWERGIISGEATYIVTPSASGSSMMSAASFAVSKAEGAEPSVDGQTEDVSKILTRLVRGWIPVAAGAVLSASSDALGIFIDLEIPILAIFGDQDAKGKESSDRLADEAGAWTLELEGRHPCYLDSPNEFIRAVTDFIDNGGSVDVHR